MKKILSFFTACCMTAACLPVMIHASAEDGTWTFGSEYNPVHDFDSRSSLPETEIGGTGFKVSTNSSNYNNVVVRNKSSENKGYYPYKDGLPDNGYYLFIGAGGNGNVAATLTLPETVDDGKYIKITYAKPYATNNGSTNRSAGNTNTFAVSGETIDVEASCEFDSWYTTTVKADSAVSEINFTLGSWSAIAVSEVEVVTSADTMELTAEGDVTEKYIIPEEEQTVKYTANIYNSITTLMNNTNVIARGTIDTEADVTYSVDYDGVSIDAGTGILTITDAAKPGTVTVNAEYGDIIKSMELRLLSLGNADGVEITGAELAKKGKTYIYHAIPKVDDVILPERAATWEITEGAEIGATISDDGELTVPDTAAAGNITIKATLKVDDVQTTLNVSDTYTVTIKGEEESPYEIGGVFLKNGAAEVTAAAGADGVIVDVPKDAPAGYTLAVKAVDSKGLKLDYAEVPLTDLNEGVGEVKAALRFKAGTASEIRSYIVNNSGEIVSDIYTAATGEYKNVPLVSDWLTGKNSGLGMGTKVLKPEGAPYGVDPELVDVSTQNVKYTYGSDYKGPDADNALWYKEGAFLAQSGNSSNSIYDMHAVDWEREALPIGNGYMAGMLFGLPDKDQIQINEETFWAAGYRGFQSKSEMPNNKVNPNMSEAINGYMSVGNIFVDFGMPKGAAVNNYYRDLNLDDAVAHVRYEYDGVKYSREYFASYPKEVLAFRYTAEGGDLNFTVNPVSMHPGDVTVNDGEITIIGRLKDSEPYSSGGNVAWSQESDLEYCTKIKVIADDGEIIDGYNKVTVSGAAGVTILVAAATDYDKDQFVLKADGTVDMTKTPYKSTRGVAAAIDKATERMNNAAAMSYDALKAEHLNDYHEQFNTVKFNLTGDEICNTPTDELQNSYNKVISTKTESDGATRVSYTSEDAYKGLDKHLEELHFNYARYMMISSSRSTTMPANLQGKWCQSVAEIWGSCYCININMEMNYWFAGGANLTDSAKSLIGWFNSQIPAGKITAKNYYNVTPKSYTLDGHTITFTDSTAAEDEVFIMHTKQSIMGTTDLTGSTSIQSPGNTAWLMYNLWDLYQTSGDETLLANDLYPIMRQVANFYTQYLYTNFKKTDASYPDGYYYTTWEGRSPEQGPYGEGIKYDLQLVAGMYDYTIAAAETLGVDADKAAAWKEIRNHLETPVELGLDGQIKEWKQETNYNKDASGADLGADNGHHRHISHLVGLYPGNLINRGTEDWLDGAKIVLNKRGDDSTGWSCSNKFLLWARALDGDRALALFRYQLAKKTYANLFDTHDPFQIDGNFGSAAGVMELLMQSQTGTIYLLPALPTVWDKGEISGIKAKNGAEISIAWADNKLTSAKITPVRDGDIEIGYDIEDTNLKITAADGSETVLKEADGVYVLKNASAGTEYKIVPTNDEPEPSASPQIELTKDLVSVKFSGEPSGVLILAGYNENGVMIKAEIIRGYASEISGYDGCAELKAFLWDGTDGMKPLCGYKSIKLR